MLSSKAAHPQLVTVSNLNLQMLYTSIHHENALLCYLLLLFPLSLGIVIILVIVVVVIVVVVIMTCFGFNHAGGGHILSTFINQMVCGI